MTEVPDIDYHCHLDLYQDYESVFRECAKRNVEVFSMTTTPLAWKRNKELSATSPNIRIGLGLHPQIVGAKEADIALFEQLIDQTRYVGEIGLDAGPRFYKTLAQQKEVFARLLKASRLSGKKILSIHSVRSGNEVLKMLEEHFPPSAGRIVFHWFSGSVAEAKRALEYGCWFSVNERMGTSHNGRKIMRALPLDRLLTETDGPFTEAKPGTPAFPWDVSGPIRVIAEIKGRQVAEVRSVICQNLINLELKN
jgi:TatD DNase family protein